uniref:somatostatin receptor type 5-like n=1 Tax=Myxine glutinosa TaxID=7769 RepID=UPI00358E3209
MYEQNVMHIFIIAMNENASIFFLMFMSIDRYLAIVHPLQSRMWRTPFRAKVCAIFIWLGALIAALPTISFDWIMFTISLFAMFGFLLPLTVIVICYILVVKSIRNSRSFHSRKHSNEKTMRLIVLIVGAFVVCWLPIHVSHIWILFNRFHLPDTHNLLVVLHYLNMMPVVNSCINPLLYGCFGENFRQGFRRLLLCRGPKKKQKRGEQVPPA